MADRADYVRFLSGHAIGLAPLFGSFQAFAEQDLGMACPDYPEMLRQDLAALGVDSARLPQVAASGGLTRLATGYVIAGSRLGLTMIRRQGYWGAAHALPSAYMEDERGLAIWKEAASLMKQRDLGDLEAQAERDAAVATFDTFRAAFVASATADVR
ncbi:heme oxygenase [Novosphingobium sp. 9U]|uniref:heme oxygenase n=1 Tax=Novosphingobium sp. 9U TaxID=2653158 RepID=UPI001F3DD1D9|nr:heme oxygenase [Novosphingobium sp. 9U]